jgi:uncharacterized protein
LKRVVIDTNVLLVSISERSKLHWIFQGLLTKKYVLCVTTDILDEYAEIIEQHLGVEASEDVMRTLENQNNIEYVTRYYRFRLLKDEDDDKFVDCAIAANASYIVSHDKDFNVLKNIEFPVVKVINTTVFKEDLKL